MAEVVRLLSTLFGNSLFFTSNNGYSLWQKKNDEKIFDSILGVTFTAIPFGCGPWIIVGNKPTYHTQYYTATLNPAVKAEE